MAQSIDNLKSSSEQVHQVDDVPGDSVTDTELSSDDILPGDSVTDTELSLLDDVSVPSGDYVVVSSYDEQILNELKVTNGLLGYSIALNILFLALFFLVFFMKVIKHNVTNLFT